MDGNGSRWDPATASGPTDTGRNAFQFISWRFAMERADNGRRGISAEAQSLRRIREFLIARWCWSRETKMLRTNLPPCLLKVKRQGGSGHMTSPPKRELACSLGAQRLGKCPSRPASSGPLDRAPAMTNKCNLFLFFCPFGNKSIGQGTRA